MSAMFDLGFPKEEVQTKECEHEWLEDEVYFCIKCGQKENILVERNYNFYEKPISVSAPYKRVNHFREQINNLCGFDNKVISLFLSVFASSIFVFVTSALSVRITGGTVASRIAEPEDRPQGR